MTSPALNPFGIRLDRMFDQPRVTVFDAIPEAERQAYYLRGAAIGALALNLLHGVNRVNSANDLYMHVRNPAKPYAHRYAYEHAQRLAMNGTYFDHISQTELAVLAQLAGRAPRPLPAVVLGFACAQYQPVRHPDTWGLAIDQEVPFSGIDPYSQEALSKLFGVDVGALPLTPGAQRPYITDPPSF